MVPAGLAGFANAKSTGILILQVLMPITRLLCLGKDMVNLPKPQNLKIVAQHEQAVGLNVS